MIFLPPPNTLRARVVACAAGKMRAPPSRKQPFCYERAAQYAPSICRRSRFSLMRDHLPCPPPPFAAAIIFATPMMLFVLRPRFSFDMTAIAPPPITQPALPNAMRHRHESFFFSIFLMPPLPAHARLFLFVFQF